MAGKMSNVQDEHKWLNVQGVPSIIWLFKSSKLTKKETLRRQSLKQKLGLVHTDTVMLDTKTKGEQRTYCDAIIYSDHIESWEKVMRDHFSTYKQSLRSVTGGH